MVVVNNNGVEYDVEKAIKNWTEYNIGWISRAEYNRVVGLLETANLRIIELEWLLTTANSRIAELEAQVASLQAQLDTAEGDLDFVYWLFSPVRPTWANLSYSCSWYWDNWIDRVNLMVWDIWVYFFCFRPSWDTAPVDFAYDYADWCIYFVDTANDYALTASRLWTRSIPKWKRSNYATVEWWWGTRYLWKKWNQLKYHVYRYSVWNLDHKTSHYTYWLYTLDIDCSTKTFSTNAYYDAVVTPYEYWMDEYHPIYRDHPELQYENLSYYPDETWTLVGNPNGDNFNPIFHWYRVMPVIVQTKSEQNCKDWNVFLEFTKAVSS